MPLVGQRGGVDARNARDARHGAAFLVAFQHAPNEIVAEAAREIRPQRLPEAIRRRARAAQLLERRQRVALRRVANPCSRERIVRADRQVLGHAFRKPQRHHHRPLLFSQDIHLERVHELVANHVIGFGQPRRKRQHDAAPNRFGHAADAFVEEFRDHIGLRKVRVAAVQDDRLARAEGMSEHVRQPRVPSFGHPRRLPRRGFFAWIVINVEMVGAQRLEVEAAILDFVATEVLRARVAAEGRSQQTRRQCEAADSSRRNSHPRAQGSD